MTLKDLITRMRNSINVAIVEEDCDGINVFKCTAPMTSDVLRPFYTHKVIWIDIFKSDKEDEFGADILVVLDRDGVYA